MGYHVCYRLNSPKKGVLARLGMASSPGTRLGLGWHAMFQLTIFKEAEI
jgi:hypothetical protein